MLENKDLPQYGRYAFWIKLISSWFDKCVRELRVGNVTIECRSFYFNTTDWLSRISFLVLCNYDLANMYSWWSFDKFKLISPFDMQEKEPVYLKEAVLFPRYFGYVSHVEGPDCFYFAITKYSTKFKLMNGAFQR